MKVSLSFEDDCTETTILIRCKELDEEVQQLLNFFKKQETTFLVGSKGSMQHILQRDDIHYFHTQNEAVYAVTATGSYKMREKLYELEQLLPSPQFIRLSKSVIVNLYELSRFESSFNGTLCVYLKSGVKEYVSRTYVPAIKNALLNRRK